MTVQAQIIQAEKSLYIGGEWQSGISTIANINPSDITQNLGHFAQASERQVQDAISAAKKHNQNGRRPH